MQSFIISDINISQCLYPELLLSLTEPIALGIHFSKAVCLSVGFSAAA